MPININSEQIGNPVVVDQSMWFSLKWRRVKGRVEAESLFDDSLEAREYQLHVLAARDRAEDAGGSILILRYISRGQC